MKNCKCNHEINSEGSGRLNRFLSALDPAYAKIDNRSFSELLVFAKNYASHIRFYQLENDCCEENTSWKNFFIKDFTVLAASVVCENPEQIKKDYLETRDSFEKNPTIQSYKALFDTILGIGLQLNKWLSRSIEGFPLHDDIKLGIESILSKQILKVFILDKSAMLINNGEGLELEFEAGDDEIWGLTNINIPIEPSLYSGVSLDKQLYNASLEVDIIFNRFYEVYTQIVEKSEYYLQISLNKYPNHQPHIALFIAFLELFKLAQEQLNGLTEKHLNYYYRDILHLIEKPAQPDTVNLIFELAQGIDIFSFAKGSQLSAGKDDLGIDQIYETNSEIVLNKARVKEIKNVFIEKTSILKSSRRGEIETKQSIRPAYNFYSRPIANSADGFGKTFEPNYPKWHPFGADATRKLTSCGKIHKIQSKNYANIGFALASPQLRLASGTRRVRLEMKGLANQGLATENFKVRITTKKEVLTLDPILKDGSNAEFINNNVNLNSGFRFDGQEGVLNIIIDSEEEAIIGFDPKIHQEIYYPTTEPVLEILFNQSNEAIDAEIFNELALKKDDDLKLTVFVTNHSTISLENEQGKLPTDKAFYPFTMIPNRGSVLKIKSDEVEAKRGIGSNDITINKLWQNNSTTKLIELNDPKNIQIILDEDLSNANTFEKLQIFAQQTKLNGISLNYTAEISKLDPKQDQFFHIYPFGVAETDTHQEYLANKFLNEIQLNYSTNSNPLRPLVSASNRVLPNFKYGITQLSIESLNKYINTGENRKILGSELNTLSTSFTKKSSMNTFSLRKSNPKVLLKAEEIYNNLSFIEQNQYNGALIQEGNLYIGIENLVAPQNLSLLFQIADGTGMDDDKDVPQIHWSYLSNNYWKPLASSNIISDDTFGLQTTGIVQLDIPKDATNNNTLLTNGLHWICISVEKDSHRFPYIINIVAQAVKATFKNNNNAETHFYNDLPANSITKIIDKPAEIKKVEQPFASRSGVPTEVGKEFWMRAGERLRHKDRAITPHDYEKLILEYYPEIFKVKAISHKDPNCNCVDIKIQNPVGKVRDLKIDKLDGINSLSDDKIQEANKELLNENTTKILNQLYCCGEQMAPGNVMIVPIANLKNRNAINILQPRTSKRTLLEIEKFLQKRVSPFVKVHTRNPIFEEILLAFRVRFNEGIDKGYYLKKLNEEIQQFLTPWAFSDTSDVPFSGKIYASAVINFIEERSCVNYITDFMMFQIKCNCCDVGMLENLERIFREYFLNQPLLNPSMDSADEVWDFIREENENIVEFAERLILDWTKYSTQEKELLIEIMKWYFKKVGELGISNPLSSITNLPNFTMTTMAEASEPRSILVSASQHIIMLEEDEIPLKPCEKKKIKTKSPQVEVKDDIKPTNETKPTPNTDLKPVEILKKTDKVKKPIK